MPSKGVLPKIGFAVLIVLTILAGNCYYLISSAAVADLPRLHIAGLSPKAKGNSVSAVLLRQNDQPQGRLQRLGNTPYWFSNAIWFHGIDVEMPRKELEKIERITVTIGDEDHIFSGAEAQAFKQAGLPADGVLLKVPLPARPSSLPWVPGWFANWPGDGRYLQAAVQATLLPGLFVGLLTFFWIKKSDPHEQAWCLYILGLAPQNVAVAAPAQAPERKPGEALWNWTGLSFLICMLTVLEWRDPYYFAQLDTLKECFPAILVGCRSFWKGVFPDYNPYVLLGAPLANLGIYALTYPPLHLSYAVARHLLQNEYATMDVFAVSHLLAGFFLTRLLGRKLGMSALPANLVALSFVLSGSALIMGRSWFSGLPVFAFMPLLFLGLLRLAAGPVSWAWILGMGLASGSIFHVGFPQLAVYVNGCYCLAVAFLVMTRALPRQRLWAVLAALVVGAGVSLPLVYQQWLAKADDRVSGASFGIVEGLAAMLLPYPLVQTHLLNSGNVNLQYLGHFYFFGGLLAFLFLFQVAGLLVFRPQRPQWSGQLWVVAGVIAFWLALGENGGLWALVRTLVNKLVPVAGFVSRYPVRLMPFVVFFAALSGGMVLERWLRTLARRPRAELLLAVPALALLVLHVAQCRTALLHFEPYQPFPELPQHFQAKFWKEGKLGKEATGRVCDWGRYVHLPSHAWQMPFNMPAVYELPTAEGSDPVLIEKLLLRNARAQAAEDPQMFLKKYGVRWFLFHAPGAWTDEGSANSLSWRIDVLSKADTLAGRIGQDPFPHVDSEGGVILSELTPVDPLAFSKGTPSQSLPLRMHSQGIDVDVADLAGNEDVIVNFLCYPELEAFVDGKSVRIFPEPTWNRIVVRLATPRAKGEATLLTIRYRPPWGRGLALGLAIAVAGLGIGWFYVRKQTVPANGGCTTLRGPPLYRPHCVGAIVVV